jgi:hypothetical protein
MLGLTTFSRASLHNSLFIVRNRPTGDGRETLSGNRGHAIRIFRPKGVKTRLVRSPPKAGPSVPEIYKTQGDREVMPLHRGDRLL